MNQVSGMVDRTVQDAFRCSANCQLVVDQSEEKVEVNPPYPLGSLLAQDVSAVLDAHNSGVVCQVRGTGPAIPPLAGGGWHPEITYHRLPSYGEWSCRAIQQNSWDNDEEPSLPIPKPNGHKGLRC